MGAFLGFVPIENTIPLPTLVKNGAVPVNADALPTFRVYGPNGLMTAGTGTTAFKDTGSITGATNAGPIVVTSANHGLSTGTVVTITGVGGNTAANGTWVITKVDANTFSLNGSTGNGAYTSGGTWNVTGLYTTSLLATAANGYASGVTYSVLFGGTISSTAWAELSTFTVT